MPPVVQVEALARGVRVVRLNRPAKLNALNMAMFEELRDAALSVGADASTRAVVLTGSGRAFCAGLDARSMSMRSAEKLLARDDALGCNLAQAVSYLWRRVPAPVVCSINGPCLGGGFQIALGADMRFAAPTAKFSVMESKWGLIPDMGLTVSALPESVPRDKAKELTMTGRVFDATEALALGLVTRVVEDPEGAALQLAEDLTRQSPDALRGAKRLLDAAYDARLLHLETLIQRKILYGWNQVAKSLDSLKAPIRPGFLNPGAHWNHEADDVVASELQAVLDGEEEAASSSR